MGGWWGWGAVKAITRTASAVKNISSLLFGTYKRNIVNQNICNSLHPTARQKDRKTERQKDRKTERQKDKKTKRLKDKKTKRQKDRKRKANSALKFVTLYVNHNICHFLLPTRHVSLSIHQIVRISLDIQLGRYVNKTYIQWSFQCDIWKIDVLEIVTKYLQ